DRAIQCVRLLRRDILNPADADLGAHLVGRTVTAIHRRAKRIIVSLDDANRFYIHLGMTGRLTVEPPDASLRPHTHLLIDISAAAQLRFHDPRRFGGVFWLGRQSTGHESLGPEPLAIRPAQLAARLRRTRRAIKTALLDQ